MWHPNACYLPEMHDTHLLAVWKNFSWIILSICNKASQLIDYVKNNTGGLSIISIINVLRLAKDTSPCMFFQDIPLHIRHAFLKDLHLYFKNEHQSNKRGIMVLVLIQQQNLVLTSLNLPESVTRSLRKSWTLCTLALFNLLWKVPFLCICSNLHTSSPNSGGWCFLYAVNN